MAYDEAVPFDTFYARLIELRDTVFIPNERRVQELGVIPDDILEQIRDAGLFAISIPGAYGGRGYTMEEQVKTHFVLCQASAVYRARVSTTIGLGSQPVLDHGTEEQKKRYLPALAAGEMTAAFALTEPDAGSDAAAITTTATADGNGWILNGTKRFITNARQADVFLVMARTGDADSGARGISAFLVPAGTPGLTIGEADAKMGQAASLTAEVYFEACRAEGDSLLGSQGNGFKVALRGINHARLHIGATCVGQAIRLTKEAFAYAHQRQQFGVPIAEHQLIQAMLADCRAETLAAKSMVLETARKFDAGTIPIGDIACCKYFASEMLGRVADRAVQIHGGQGYMQSSDVEWMYRDARLFRIYEGTSQIQQGLIAKEMARAGDVGLWE